MVSLTKYGAARRRVSTHSAGEMSSIREVVAFTDLWKRRCDQPLRLQRRPGGKSQRVNFGGRQKYGALQQAAEFLLGDVVMRALPGGEIVHGFVFHVQPLQTHDAQILVAVFPNLALSQFHLRNDKRSAGGLASAIRRGRIRRREFRLFGLRDGPILQYSGASEACLRRGARPCGIDL